jgi:acetyl esterase/lipase
MIRRAASMFALICSVGGALAAGSDAPSLPALPDSLSPQALAQLKAAASAPPPGATVTVEQMRAFADQFQTFWSAKQQAKYAVSIKEDVIAGVPVRVIEPTAAKADASRVLLDLHGGGFILDSGSLTENVPIAALTGMKVVAVRYRLAPEHPFPAAVDDALSVYRTLLKTYSATHIGIYGTSAGAILGPELIARVAAEGLPRPGALGVFSGNADLARMGDSTRLFPFQMGDMDLAKLSSMYAGSAPLNAPAVSPLYGSLQKFPPTLCIASGRDFLLSGTVNFCRALTLASVPSNLVVFDGLPHAFWTYIDAPESDEAFKLMADFLVATLGGKSQTASHH